MKELKLWQCVYCLQSQYVWLLWCSDFCMFICSY